MSRENLKLFLEEVERDAELKGKINELNENHNENILNRLREIGQEEGYEFTNEDLKAFNQEVVLNMLEKGELSEDDLESVSGGLKFEGEIRLTVMKPEDLLIDKLKMDPKSLLDKLF